MRIKFDLSGKQIECDVKVSDFNYHTVNCWMITKSGGEKRIKRHLKKRHVDIVFQRRSEETELIQRLGIALGRRV